MNIEVNKVLASTVIVLVSWVVLYRSCLRASTIYFFELDSTKVVFMTGIHALAFPLILSALLYFVYLGTKRNTRLENDRKIAEEREKQLINSSQVNSRKASKDFSRKSSINTEETDQNQQRIIKRLLSDITEQEHESTIRTGVSESSKPARDIFAEAPNRFVVENVPEQPKIITPMESRSRAGSVKLLAETSRNSSRKSSLNGLMTRSSRNILETDSSSDLPSLYSKFGDMDLLSYSMNALIPTSKTPRVYLKLGLIDIVSELFAIHVPIWACVICLHIILLELFGQHVSFYFYYHEESMAGAAMSLSFAFGLIHEFYGGWVSNNILAFSSIYVVSSRIQAISFQTASIFSMGMVVFDLFFLYAVDLLSTVTRENKTPLMITVPRDNEGRQQSLATLDIMVPAIFLNVINKYSSMYDGHLFFFVVAAVFVSLMMTMFIAIYRSKVTPAIVLPAITGIAVSLSLASHPADLWKFMIKH